MAAESQGETRLGPLELPDEGLDQPVFGRLDLPARGKALPKQPMFIADAVAMRRAADRGQRFHETGRKPPQPAIAQRRVRFVQQQGAVIQAKAVYRRLRLVRQLQVDDIVLKQPADQELHRQVIDPPGAGAPGGARRFHPAVHDAVAHRMAQRQPPVEKLRMVGILAQRIGQVPQDRVADAGLGRIVPGHGSPSLAARPAAGLSTGLRHPSSKASAAAGQAPGPARSGQKSRPRSRVRAEWVSAPTEM